MAVAIALPILLAVGVVSIVTVRAESFLIRGKVLLAGLLRRPQGGPMGRNTWSRRFGRSCWSCWRKPPAVAPESPAQL